MDNRDKELDKPFKVSIDEGILDKYLEGIQDINSYSEFPEVINNPFLCSLNNMLKKGYKAERAVSAIARGTFADPDTGEVMDVTAPIRFGHAQVVDRNKFVKIYGDNLKNMFSLSGPALKVYGYFISQMVGRPMITEIYFRLQGCMDFTGYAGRSNIYLGLCELIKAGFIAKTNRPPSFFVNPLYAFNGDVVDTYNRYILEGSGSEKEFIAAQNESQQMLIENNNQTDNRDE
jgi:hypothetical protein